jgi:3-hydroxyisobutyrate dehydrogenase-like beta-hydroxyacid dehydrogenase
MKVAVLGLGEAGSLIAADLASGGDEVHGYDPAGVDAPQGVTVHTAPSTAVSGCGLVLALTPGSRAREALAAVVDHLEHESVYADLSTGAPALKAEMASMAAHRGVLFADVALMAPVPGRGLTAPALVSGTGAERYAELTNGLGGNVVVVGPEAGEAATRKLLRSVVMKGLAAVLIESMEAGRSAGKGDWLWDHLVDELSTLDEQMLRRLLHDTPLHAGRRLDEMEAARDMLLELGVSPVMTTATIAHLRRLVHPFSRADPGL